MQPVRRLRRFYSTQPLVDTGQVIHLTPSETHHLRDIIRLKAGARCLITDGNGNEAEAKIIDFLEGNTCRLILETIHKLAVSQEKLKIRVGLALTKKDKMDYLIEKAQELGVEEFWPIEAERSVVRIPKDKQLNTLARWKKKAIGAAKQSGALNLLNILSPRTLQAAVEAIPLAEQLVLFHPAQDALPFQTWVNEIRELRDLPPQPEFRLNLFFGPEGGFSEQEIKGIKTQREKRTTSCRMVSLGKNILKMDTAFIGVISSLRFLSL